MGIDGQPLGPGRLGYLEPGSDEVGAEVRETARVMLLGGVPFEEQILMWWNFVGRSRDEIDAAYASWEGPDERFGSVASALPRIPVKAPFWQ